MAHKQYSTATTTSSSDLDSYEGTTRQDVADMAAQGKIQRFHRNFSFWPLLSFTASLMCSWEAVFFANNTAMVNGGPPTLIYGFCFCFCGALATAASLAEMASFAPTSGGQYHWTALLAPKKFSVSLSWLTGWIATIGWQANTAAGVFFSGTMIQGLIVLNNPTYDYQRWHGTLLMWAILLLCATVNTLTARLLPKIEYFFLTMHTLGFIAVLVPLLILAPKASASSVFQEFVNTAGWNSNGLTWFVGLISGNLPLIGYDAAAHMAEEVRNASSVVPRAMVGAVLLNGILGLGVCIAFSFTVGDISAALGSPTGYDFIEVFFAATKSLAGSSTMTAILIALVTSASIGFLATASRQTWAFARDHGLPASKFLAHVDPRWNLPLRAVLVSAIAPALICLINIGSTVAFNAIVSFTTAGLFTSYAIPISLLLYKRINGGSIHPGPWTMGRFGIVANVVSLVFLTVAVFFSFWPPAVPVSAVSMNWSCVMFGGVLIIGLVWYLLVGRTSYHGPVVEAGEQLGTEKTAVV